MTPINDKGVIRRQRSVKCWWHGMNEPNDPFYGNLWSMWLLVAWWGFGTPRDGPSAWEGVAPIHMMVWWPLDAIWLLMMHGCLMMWKSPCLVMNAQRWHGTLEPRHMMTWYTYRWSFWWLWICMMWKRWLTNYLKTCHGLNSLTWRTWHLWCIIETLDDLQHGHGKIVLILPEAKRWSLNSSPILY